MSFQMFLAGAEAPAWRKLLIDEGVGNMATSFTSLRSRLPKTKPYLLKERFPDGIRILVDSGGYGAKAWNESAHDEHMDLYVRFVESNLDRLDLVTEYDPENLSLEWIQAWRKQFWDSLPSDKFMPIWHERYGLEELEELAAHYDNVGITTTERNINARLNGIVARYGVRLHGVAITDPDDLRDVRFSSAMSTSWISPMRYGETQVWDGNRLRRYPTKYKDQARRRHRMLFEHAGFDADKICKDDGKEVARFTIWSWLRLEEAMDRKRSVRRITRSGSAKRATIEPDQRAETNEDPEGEVVGTHLPERRNPELVPREGRKFLPVLGFEQRQGTNPQDGSPLQVQVPVLSKATIRHCDSCYIAGSCPEFSPHNQCAFDLPIEIRTKDQLMGAITSILEMQLQRVAFGRFTEENEGGYPDPNVSNEMDRFMKMTLAMKELADNREFFRVEVEARGQAGLLSQVFGDIAKSYRSGNGEVDPRHAERVMQDVVEGKVTHE